MPNQIASLPKGAVIQPPDPRDFSYLVVSSILPVDWSKPFANPEPPDSDQGQALRCVAESTSYFHWQLKNHKFSPKDIYSQIYLPQGGAYLRDGPGTITTVGQQTLLECGDPNPNNEANNRIKCANPQQALDALEGLYYGINGKSIDIVALAIRDHKGCIIGVQGDNIGWQDLSNPVPPAPLHAEWGHALYLFGYHLHNGVKCVIAKSSWCNTGIKEHHIKQDYFDSGNTFDGWVIIPKDNTMIEFVHKAGTQEYGFLETTQYSSLYLRGSSESDIKFSAQKYGIQILNLDGTINFNSAREISI